MCNMPIITFFIEYADIEDFRHKRVLEVGSKYINGSIRPFIEKFLQPQEYVGIDIQEGKFVDILLSAEEIIDYFGKKSFDVVIATEIIEHIRDWRLVIQNFKDVLKEEGHIFITTRSIGFPQHGYPYDYWRFEIDDMKEIFSDFKIKGLVKDKTYPGVFLKAKKPLNYKKRSMDNIKLYNIKESERRLRIPDKPSRAELMSIQEGDLEQEEYYIESVNLQNKEHYSLEDMGLKERFLHFILKQIKKIEDIVLYHLG